MKIVSLFLYRSLFSRKGKDGAGSGAGEEHPPGWKLFGRVPPKDGGGAPLRDPSRIQEEYQARVREGAAPAPQHHTPTPAPTQRVKKSDVEVLSTTALILENRPQ